MVNVRYQGERSLNEGVVMLRSCFSLGMNAHHQGNDSSSG